MCTEPFKETRSDMSVHMHRCMFINVCTCAHMHTNYVCDSSVYSFSYNLLGLMFKFHYNTHVTHTHWLIYCLFLVHNKYIPQDLYMHMPIHAHPYTLHTCTHHMHTHACPYIMHTHMYRHAHTHVHTCTRIHYMHTHMHTYTHALSQHVTSPPPIEMCKPNGVLC